jgi:FGGY-family pentulose kinase
MTLVMAVDVGSTSARAGLFDPTGNCLSRTTAEFTTSRPLLDYAEHSSDEIWASVCAASRAALRQAGAEPGVVGGLAFDAACSLAVFDSAGWPVSVSTTRNDRWNVVMWADHRAEAEAEEITATGHRALQYVGGVMSPEMQLPKLLWLKRHVPESWARIGLAFDLADFLAWRATGRVTMSACTVTCKWAFLGHEKQGWQPDLLDRIGLQDFRARVGLPDRSAPIGAALGRLSSAGAAELGLSENCVVGTGLIDAHAGGLALLGARDPAALNRSLAMIAGTSTCHMAVSAAPRFVPGVWGPYAGAMLPGTWLNEGGQSATGALLDHVLDWHAEGRGLGGDRHAKVTERVVALLEERGPAMAAGMRVLPDFNGNRSPLANPAARGTIEGLSLDASFDSLARLYYAAASGIALGTRHIVDALNASGYEIDTLHLAGGHVASMMLPQLYADATGCKVIVRDNLDSVLAGTACAAAAASGLHPTLEASARAFTKAERAVTPRPECARHFDLEYRHFLRMSSQAHAPQPALSSKTSTGPA